MAAHGAVSVSFLLCQRDRVFSDARAAAGRPAAAAAGRAAALSREKKI
jgi:hypothetical protein